jgi:hypothetical protein
VITERHNSSFSMIFKAISKTGSLESCFVCMYLGSSERLAMQNLQIPNTAENRIVPKWLFPPRFSNKNRFISSRPDAVLLVASISAKEQQTSNEGGWVLRSGKGQLRETGSTSTAPPAATNRSTFSRQHQPRDLSILQREIHLIMIKYCEDTRPQNQLSAAQEQHKDLCSNLQGASATLLTIFLGVVPSTTITRWSLLRIWVLILKELRNLLLPSFMLIICQLLRCRTCPYQMCPFKHYYQLSSGDRFRSSSLLPS